MSVPEATMEQIAALVVARQAKSRDFEKARACEVTVMIPCRNAFCWESGSLNATLDSLRKQSLPFKVVLCDNGSEDGTQLILRAMAEPTGEWEQDKIVRAFWLRRFPHGLAVAEAVPTNEDYAPGQMRINAHLKALYANMLALVDTPYVVTVDADVDVPAGGLWTMLEALKADPELWMVGIKYGEADHIQHGLTMMATERFRVLEWPDEEQTCSCRFVFEEMRRTNRKVLELSGLSARHTRLE